MIQITNGLIRIEISKREVESYLKSGWKLVETAKMVVTPTQITEEVNAQQEVKYRPKRKKSK